MTQRMTARRPIADTDFSFKILGRVLHATAYPMHTHDFTELVLILGGSGAHIIDGTAYPITAGDIFVLQGNQAHGFQDPRQLKLSICPERLPLPPSPPRYLCDVRKQAILTGWSSCRP